MPEKKMKVRKPLMQPKKTSVPWKSLQEQGMFSETNLKNPMGKENFMEKRRDVKRGKK